MKRLPLLSSATLLAFGTPALAQNESNLPEPVRAMIIAAMATGDGKTVETVVRLAKETNGQAAHEIDQMFEGFRSRMAETQAAQERRKIEMLAEAGPFERWRGQAELGAARSTGNTRNLGVYGALSLERDGIRWRHKVTGRVDLQETNGVTSGERLLASWQPNYRVHERFYAYGIAEYEYDRFQGYDNRFTLGGGGGYGLIAGPRAKLDLEGGPAFRHTDHMRRAEETTVAARASVNFSWAITPTLEFKQNSSVYFEPGDSSASALSVLDAKLIGPLKARFSYDIRYEDGVPAGAEEINTQSRATLVYSF